MLGLVEMVRVDLAGMWRDKVVLWILWLKVESELKRFKVQGNKTK